MDWFAVQNDWEHFKGKIKARWLNLTEEDLDQIAGSRVELSGRIQKTYDITRLQAELEIRGFEARHRRNGPRQTA